MLFPKPGREIDPDVLAAVRLLPCAVCGAQPVDPCHIKSRGAGGPDSTWNVLAMCRGHHSEQHSRGWETFLRKYPHLVFKLERLGWEMPWRSETGKLWHPELNPTG